MAKAVFKVRTIFWLALGVLALLLAACGGNSPTPNPGGPFQITRIEPPPPVTWNTEEEWKIFWQGDPVAFPVTVKYRVEDCPSDFECGTSDNVFEEQSNPLILVYYCEATDSNSPPVFHSYGVHLVDNEGRETQTETFEARCVP